MQIEWRYSLVNNVPFVMLSFILSAVYYFSPVNWDRLSISLIIFGGCWLGYYFLFQRPFFKQHPEEKPGSHIISGLGWILTVLLVGIGVALVTKTAFFNPDRPAILIGYLMIINLLRDALSVKKLAMETKS